MTGMMGTRWAKAAFLLAMAIFFAALAMDIAVPALVLSMMALSNRVVLESSQIGRWKGRTV